MLSPDRMTFMINRALEAVQRRKQLMEEVLDREVSSQKEQDITLPSPVFPIYDSFKNNTSAFKLLTGFNVTHFDYLYEDVATLLIRTKRGRPPRITGKDILFIVLYYVRRYPKFEDMQSTFSISYATIEKTITEFLPIIADRFFLRYVKAIASEEEWPHKDEFNNADLIVDATVQKINRPCLDYQTAKQWYSGKHSVYCLKTQVVTNRLGVAMHVTDPVPGSIHDLTLFRDSLPEILELIEKHKEGKDEEIKILADLGYYTKDLEHLLITPIKSIPSLPANEQRDAEKFNQSLSRQRIRVENYFGRLKKSFDILAGTYRGGHEIYKHIVRLCTALTNYKLVTVKEVLAESDHDYYHRHTIVMQRSAEDAIQKKKQQRKRAAENRRRQLEQ